jgi:hypothetical protein
MVNRWGFGRLRAEWSTKLGIFVLCEKTVTFCHFSSCVFFALALNTASPKRERRRDVLERFGIIWIHGGRDAQGLGVCCYFVVLVVDDAL